MAHSYLDWPPLQGPQKRHKAQNGPNQQLVQSQGPDNALVHSQFSEPDPEELSEDKWWSSHAFYTQGPSSMPLHHYPGPSSAVHATASRKRKAIGLAAEPSAIEQTSFSHQPQPFEHESQEVGLTYLTGFLQQQLPEYYTSMPDPRSPLPDVSKLDPFAEEIDNVRHAPRVKKKISKNGHASSKGYIKFQLRYILNSPQSRGNRRSLSSDLDQDHEQALTPPSPFNIPRLPSNLDKLIKLDLKDERLLKFYLVGYSEGRTLVKSDNFWLKDIPAMIPQSECVLHCVLALAATYLLDYVPDRTLLDRANHHYRMARHMIVEALRHPESHRAGKEEALIASLALLTVDDVVTWEQRKPQNQEPRWYGLVKAAKPILDHADPGVKYYKSGNVQTTKARHEIACWIAYVHIITEMVTPLKFSGPRKIFPWLLHGGSVTRSKIHGVTGASPELLHIFAQITDLASRLERKPANEVLLMQAGKIRRELNSLQQWSTNHNRHYAMQPESLLQKYQHLLDPLTKKLVDERSVVDVTSQAWVAAAQIYLHCRLYRRPRTATAVREAMARLKCCVQMLPWQGPLFTAQAPFCPIFIMGLAALPEDRDTTTAWFKVVCANAGERCSVPPVWDSLRRIWQWIDATDPDLCRSSNAARLDSHDEPWVISGKHQWWDEMVAWIVEEEGTLSLA